MYGHGKGTRVIVWIFYFMHIGWYDVWRTLNSTKSKSVTQIILFGLLKVSSKVLLKYFDHNWNITTL